MALRALLEEPEMLKELHVLEPGRGVVEKWALGSGVVGSGRVASE